MFFLLWIITKDRGESKVCALEEIYSTKKQGQTKQQQGPTIRFWKQNVLGESPRHPLFPVYALTRRKYERRGIRCSLCALNAQQTHGTPGGCHKLKRPTRKKLPQGRFCYSCMMHPNASVLLSCETCLVVALCLGEWKCRQCKNNHSKRHTHTHTK